MLSLVVTMADKVLDIRGPRGGLTADRARGYVEPVLSGRRRDFEKVVLSTWAFSVEAAEVLSEAIRLLPDLRFADLADIIAGRPEAEGLAVFRALGASLKDKRLRMLDLSDNAVGPKGVEATREMLTGQEDLEELAYCNCGMSAEALRSVSDIVLFRVPTKLKCLRFANNMSGSGGAIAVADIVAASPDLAEFRFSSSRGGREGGIALAAALASTRKLQRLDVSDNMFGLPGSLALCRMLAGPASAHLRELNLSDIGMGDVGAEALAQNLAQSSCVGALQSLALVANDIGPKGAKHVASVLPLLPALKTLRLEENELEDEGVAWLVTGLADRQKHLPAGAAEGLAVVNLSQACLTAPAVLSAARELVQALPSLTTLDLSGNTELSEAQGQRVQALLEAAGKPCSVVTVDAGEEGEDDDEEAASAEAEMRPCPARSGGFSLSRCGGARPCSALSSPVTLTSRGSTSSPFPRVCRCFACPADISEPGRHGECGVRHGYPRSYTVGCCVDSGDLRHRGRHPASLASDSPHMHQKT